MSTSSSAVRPSPSMPAQPLRVLMICYEYPPLGGGIATACSYLLSEMIPRKNIEIELVTSGTSPSVEIVDLAPHIRIHRLPVAKRDLHYWRSGELAEWAWRALPYARRLVGSQRFDLAHCWASWPSGVVGWHLRRRLAYIVSLRGSDVPGYSDRLRRLDPIVFRPIVRQVLRNASHVSAISRELRALAWQTAPDVAIDLIPNGVDTVRFRPGDCAGRINLMFAGRLIVRKGVRDLIEAFARLDAPARLLKLIIAGDGPERGSLETRTRELGLAERVEFLGHLKRDRLAEVYREAGIFVLPSRSEALSNVVLEAMASGLAIVTTATGAREVLSDNGFVVPPADVAALQTAIEHYLERPDLLARHQRRSRDITLGLAWTAVAEHFAAIYGNLASIPSDRAADLGQIPSAQLQWRS